MRDVLVDLLRVVLNPWVPPIPMAIFVLYIVVRYSLWDVWQSWLAIGLLPLCFWQAWRFHKSEYTEILWEDVGNE